MGAFKPGDGQKASNRSKVKYTCRADTRGGSWCGIPSCLIGHASYRDLSLHARAALIEITARMNGSNNGEIAISQRELVDALGCHNRRAIGAVVELIDHGFLVVACEGQWHQRQARQYRLTFVSTPTAGATNDYLHWTPAKAKSRDATVEAEQGQSGATVASRAPKAGATVASRIQATRRRPSETADATLAPLISKPCPPVPTEQHKGDHGSSESPLKPGGDRFGHAMGEQAEHRTCEHCRADFELERPDRTYARRFCSETCRKKAEAARLYQRRKAGEDDAAPIGQVLNGHLSRIMAGQVVPLGKAGRAH